MAITFYKCKSDPNALVPEYDTTTASNAIGTTPYEPLDDLTGYVILDYNSSYEGYDKAYLSDTGKYYTITSRSLDPGHKIKVFLDVDVMKTYADEIDDCEVIVTRTSGAPENAEARIGWNTLIKDARNITMVNDDCFEVQVNGMSSDPVTGEELIPQSEFGFDSRPYLLAVGCNAPVPKKEGATKDNLDTYSTGQQN